MSVLNLPETRSEAPRVARNVILFDQPITALRKGAGNRV